jgi:hypothetical protein
VSIAEFEEQGAFVFDEISGSKGVRSWPNSEAHLARASVSFGEIFWIWRGKFLNFGFGKIYRQ